MAQITATQNQSLNLKRLVAQRYLYSLAKRVSRIQAIVVFSVPAASTIATALCDEFRPWGAFLCLMIIPLDGFFFAWLKRRYRERAAAIQEDFDCNVLELPWNEVLAGSRPTEEEIYLAHSKAIPVNREHPKDWYPRVLDSLPLHQARIICQRSNCRWDAQLRDHSRIAIWTLFIFICICFTAIGMFFELYTHTLVVYIIVPLAPTLVWSIREANQQKSAANISRCLQCRLTTLLDQTVNGDLAGSEAKIQSREIQNKIFLYRSAYPPVPDWIYRWSKQVSEEAMKEAASEIVTRISSG